MIIQNLVTIGNKTYKHTKSDQNKCILQQETGLIFDDALDVIDSNYTYIETDTPITIFDEKEI